MVPPIDLLSTLGGLKETPIWRSKAWYKLILQLICVRQGEPGHHACQHLQQLQCLWPTAPGARADGAVVDDGVRLHGPRSHGNDQLDGPGPIPSTAAGVDHGAVVKGGDVAMAPEMPRFWAKNFAIFNPSGKKNDLC